MQKIALIALLASAALCEKIPLSRKPLKISQLRDFKARVEGKKFRPLQFANSDIIPIKDYMNTQYFATVRIGTPEQKFTMVPDTGSSNVWAYSSQCTDVPCYYHETYKATQSSTYEKDGADFKITYGSGSITGYQSQDTVKLGGASASHFKFGEILSVDGAAFYASDLSGILGLAYQTISVNGLPTFLDSSDAKEKSFAFYLHNNPEKSYMTLPGYDESKMGGQNWHFHDVVEQRYYSLKLVSVAQGTNKIDASAYKAVIDSGTSLIMGPESIINKLVDGIPEEPDCDKLADLPDITFTIDDKDYVLKPDDYVLKVSDGGETQCVRGIMGGPFPETFDYIIVGDVFFRRYWAYFDKANNQVGFINAQ